MYLITYLTYLKESEYPHRFVYTPPFVSEDDRVYDVTELSTTPNPNVVVWEGVISAATLDAWLVNPDIYILMYEAVNEPV